ncbi:MAG: PqiC family protein [Alphaproteobacteria bacterium]|nr:PqiC family protein [Alphaproteobacteria bacterium]
MLLKALGSRAAFVVIGFAMLVGCTVSQPTNFYTLFDLAESREQVDGEPPRLGVASVNFPAYLDRPQIVTRRGSNRIAVAEFDHWAEPLETTVVRVLRENLSSQLGSDLVVALPLRRNLPLDRQVEVEIARFDADERGEVVLDANWRIFDGGGGRMLGGARSVIREQATIPDDYESIAEAMSLCLALMSKDIAEAL